MRLRFLYSEKSGTFRLAGTADSLTPGTRNVQNGATSRGSVTGPRPSETWEALGFAPDRRAARTARSGRPRRGRSRSSGNPEPGDEPVVAVQLAGAARRS